MGELPKDTIYDILSRMPVKSLARFRCVCKQWCKYINDPYLANIHVKQESTPIIILHQCRLSSHYSCTLSFSCIIEDTSVEVLNEPFYRSIGIYYFESSCNGLIFLSHYLHRTNIIVINPLRKECYKLPPFTISSRFAAQGFGFDDSTNTFKVVCVFCRKSPTNIDVREKHCAVVHVLGTALWREIPQVPFYPISGEAVFYHGYLYWCTNINLDSLQEKVIQFDVTKEESGLIDSPKQKKKGYGVTNHHLVDLDGGVGFVYNIFNVGIEVWILKQKEWVIYCQFDKKWPLSKGCITGLGCWNKDGDILIKCIHQRYVYRLKSDTLNKVNIIGREDGSKWVDIRMYQSNLLSIHSIKTN